MCKLKKTSTCFKVLSYLDLQWDLMDDRCCTFVSKGVCPGHGPVYGCLWAALHAAPGTLPVVTPGRKGCPAVTTHKCTLIYTKYQVEKNKNKANHDYKFER